MGTHASRQRRQVVAAFQRGYQPTMRVCARQRQQLRGDPREIFRLELQVGQRIAAVRIKAGADHYQLRAKGMQARQQQAVPQCAEFGRPGPRRQRAVDYIADAAFVLAALVWLVPDRRVERFLRDEARGEPA